MTANIVFPNVKAYNVTKFDVRVEETFRIELDEPGARWFTDNDPVLDLSVSPDGDFAIVKTKGDGPCEIQIQRDGTTVLKLDAMVYTIEAATLGLTAGAKELK